MLSLFKRIAIHPASNVCILHLKFWRGTRNCMETNSPADETQGEPGDQAETYLPAKVKRVDIYRLAFILAGSLVLIYFAWRISEDQRRLSQLEQANQVLQEDMEDYQQRLKITAGQLDMMLSAITQA